MTAIIILLVLFLQFGILFAVSLFTSKKHTDNEAFFIGNKQSPWYIVAIGMIGTSISGVTFISVPGWVNASDMTYIQMALGFIFGYIIVANVLLPLYYKFNYTSIYTYLNERIGIYSYKTGASFFLLSKLLGSAARLYVIALILQKFVFDNWNIPFYITVTGIVVLIYLYTFRGGIRTLVWTDMLQTIFLLIALILIIFQVINQLNFSLSETVTQLTSNEHFRIFEFDAKSPQNFFKQFFSGIFVVIVMTGLDQDMMQKNLSCRNLKESQKNMYSYAWTFVPINFLFLCLGILLLIFAQNKQLPLPVSPDEILPSFAISGKLGMSVLIFFTLGIAASAFNSADSALTSLTTSFCVDILNIKKYTADKAQRIRFNTHIVVSVVFILVILVFGAINEKSIIDAIYILVSYTYGPLLGLFTFGLFTKKKANDKWVPYICILAPALCYLADSLTYKYFGYKFGYELLILNGLLTFSGILASCRFIPKK